MTDTRTILENLFCQVAGSGWADDFAAALDEDLVFTAAGTSPVAGRYVGKQTYLDQILGRLGERLQSWPKPIVDKMIVDGNSACVQFHSKDGLGKNGADFNMQYCWVLNLRNEKIVEITGYYDSGKMIALFKD